MNDELIFTLTDVRSVRNVSVNIEDFDLYAKEVQRNYLQKLIGDKLYLALLADLVGGVPQTAVYADLVNGKVYNDGEDHIFRGVKLYCVYCWLHMYMATGDLDITPTGSMLFKDENAERRESATAIRNAKAHFIAAADGLEEPTLRFLTKNITDYPEFSESKQIEQAENDNLTFKVIKSKFRTPPTVQY